MLILNYIKSYFIQQDSKKPVADKTIFFLVIMQVGRGVFIYTELSIRQSDPIVLHKITLYHLFQCLRMIHTG